MSLKTIADTSHPLVRNRAARICAVAGVVLTLASCGGGTSPSAVSASGGALPDTSPVLLANCLDGNQPNGIGADDPFYVNSWHLENTGPTQVVSASSNEGVAGIDANVKSVHQGGRGCTGKGVTVAIVDSGLEIAHEDLAANVLPGKSFNFITNSSDPTTVPAEQGLEHGTSVAGVALAQGWNGKGSRGLAPNASVVGYNLLANAAFKPFGATDVRVNAAFLAYGAAALADRTIEATNVFGSRADKVDVFNFSFGRDYAAPKQIQGFSPQHEAVKRGTEILRNGRGAIYLQSAGNEFEVQRDAMLPNGETISVYCVAAMNKDVLPGGELAGGVFQNPEEASCGDSGQEPDGRPYAYSVAAVHNTGRASSYSSSGAVNWITGFGGEYGNIAAAVVTTDSSGCNAGANNMAEKRDFEASFSLIGDALKAVADLFGASAKDPSCNYTGRMNGTSAAAPSVSGVVALMLEVNPRLTWQDVGYIMAKTARKIDADVAAGARAVSFAGDGATGLARTLTLDLPWQTNSGGFNFQNRYGFGLIDAAAATRLARDFTPPPGRRSQALIAVTSIGDATSADTAGGKYSSTSATVRFADPVAVSGQMRVELLVDNQTSENVNPGRIQFEMTNNRTGQTSVLMPAFSSWYVGGKNFGIKPDAEKRFRFHTNAFYGDKLSDGYTVKTTYIRPAGTAGGALDFMATVTSFSM